MEPLELLPPTPNVELKIVDLLRKKGVTRTQSKLEKGRERLKDATVRKVHDNHKEQLK